MRIQRLARAVLTTVLLATLLPFPVLPQGEAAHHSATATKSGAAPTSAAAIPHPDGEKVFERFKALAGRWEGRSTKGWTGTSNYSVIARGSVVMGLSEFTDAPGHGMATMIYMDGDRLLLTHYCEARNQPRLVATGVEEGGRVVVFTFLDGTNLASRDVGHMDKVIVHFPEDDHFTSRWTWYQNGQETWMEEITYTRLRDQR